MASISALSRDHARPDIESIRALVISINEYILELLANTESWNSLKSKCTSRLSTQTHIYFEFADHSVLSNLYWGIEGIEAAVQAQCPAEKATLLRNSEGMLQVPALLDEYGVTAGIRNCYLVCCAYFYLSVVKKLQDDEWQAAMHFLQALLVSPRLVQEEFELDLARSLFCSSIMSVMEALGGSRSASDKSIRNFNEHNFDEAITQSARRYKHWLMYYQVMLHGDTPQWHHRSKDTSALEDKSHCFSQTVTNRSDSSNSIEQGSCFQNYEKVHPLDPMVCVLDNTAKQLNQAPESKTENKRHDECASMHCLGELLMESESDTPTSVTSSYYYDSKGGELEAPCSTLSSMYTTMFVPPDLQDQLHDGVNASNWFSGRLDLCISGDRENLWSCHLQECSSLKSQQPCKAQVIEQEVPTALRRSSFLQHKRSTWQKQNSNRPKGDSGKDLELMAILEKAVPKLYLSEGLVKCEDYSIEVTTIYELLDNKRGARYTMLKDVILNQLLKALSTSKEERIIRASVSILTSIISVNMSALEELKMKGLQLCDLANALKQKVHEAAILIYLINPSPTEIKTLELLPSLVDVVCTSSRYKEKPKSLLLTPPAASLMMIEVLVTAFDCATNNMHLSAISSPHILCRILDLASGSNSEEYFSLAKVLIKCMQFDGQCRKYVSQSVAVAPFQCLLQSNKEHAKFTALEFFHEILCVPRSSAISVMHRIQKEGGAEIVEILEHCVQTLQSDYQLLAANILLQLETLENPSGTSVFREESMKIILKSLASEEGSSTQQLSAFILANIGGTYAWTGEPYTVAWLVKKAGLSSLHHCNMIKNFDWLDDSLQDAGIDSWSGKVAKGFLSSGKPIFRALNKGLNSKIKKISLDSLTVAAWLGFEVAKCPNGIRHSACNILFNGIEHFLHPGSELEERLLACLCIYNYASGRGMQKLFHFSEGVRESLRRLSSVIWMAEELHRVADYYLPNGSRISCVHKQILEANCSSSGSVTALVYYRGLLCSGCSNGSIKVWDIEGQSATLLWHMKEHKKAVTCFALFESGESLISGSVDKTIRVWKVVERKLECIEVVTMKEPIRKLETYGQMIVVITQGHRIKILDPSRAVKDVCKTKKVKCMIAVQGKLYIGCMDSSIQELAMTNNREREIKAPTKFWRMQQKPINSIVVYKDWLYSGSSTIEGSKLKECRVRYNPQFSTAPEKGGSVIHMGVVEDFVYINGSSSTSTIQIWLRGSQQKVGRISAGSKITSLLTANDIILCGTEKGLIKGWIPL
uniref:Uncharacterized protein n=1 Tax=Rhizophora mucronata TaxID=61149 RepID=A0A2P2NXX6_RHIMU